MSAYFVLFLAGLAAASYDSHTGCHCEKGCGPGYEKSYLDYRGRFKGGADQFVPVYQRFVSSEHECKVKGGCGAHPHHDHKPHKYHEKHEDELDQRYKRHAEYRQPCKCEKGCGPGYEQSFLKYGGRFKGGALKLLPVYERETSEEYECKVKGGCGAHPHHDHHPHKYQEKYEHGWEHRYKRHAEYRQPCKCEKGCGPGYEQSFLKYGGGFKGGARKWLPVYVKHTSEEHECKVKGGCGARDHEYHKQGHEAYEERD